MRYLLGAALVVALVWSSVAVAATDGSSPTGGPIQFASAAAAKDPASGIPSFELAPGTTTTFTYPTATGRDDITIASTKRRSFNSTIFGWTFTLSRTSLGVEIWRWKHYTEWAGNGQCITQKLSNIAWSAYNSPGWSYPGNTTYFIWTINPVCYPLGTLWSGRQGHYYSWVWHQDDYPWELGEAYATGNYRTYDWGCSGAC